MNENLKKLIENEFKDAQTVDDQLNIIIERLYSNKVTLPPDSWYAGNGPTDEDPKDMHIDLALGKLRALISKLDQRLTKAGL